MSNADEGARLQQLRDTACQNLSAANQHFCTDSTLGRYLRARGASVTKAAAMLRATLEWRDKARPDLTEFEDISEATVTGRVELLGDTDSAGRPIILYRLRQKMPDLSPEMQVKFLTYILENSSHVADQTGIGKACWLFDMAAYDRRNSPPLKVVRECIGVLQNHYPERLGQAIVFQPNTVFRWAYTLISPFLDSVTRGKVVFIDAPTEEERHAQLAKYVCANTVATCTSEANKINTGAYAERMQQVDEQRKAAYNAFCKASQDV